MSGFDDVDGRRLHRAQPRGLGGDARHREDLAQRQVAGVEAVAADRVDQSGGAQAVAAEPEEIVVARDVVIVLGAICYQWFIAPVQAEPAAISKLNTACQLAMLFFTLTAAAYAWPPPVSLMVLGATVVFTSIVSGLNYVLRWGSRAWRVAHGVS